MGEKDKTLLELRGFSETRDKKCSGRAWLVVSLNKYQLLLLPAWNGALPTKGPVLLWDWKLLLEKAYTQACTDMCMHVHACTRMYTYVCVPTCVRTCVHAHTHVYVHAHTQTGDIPGPSAVSAEEASAVGPHKPSPHHCTRLP